MMIIDHSGPSLTFCFFPLPDEPQDLLNLRGALKFYIKKWNYGSRTHTVVLVRGDGSASYVEKTVEDGKWIERRTDFKMDL